MLRQGFVSLLRPTCAARTFFPLTTMPFASYHRWLDTDFNAPPKENRILTLHELKNNPGARQTKKRLGRGPGSGRGKTSGRGHKGTYARSGGSVSPWFQGGQTPFYRRLPKVGLQRPQKQFKELRLDRLMSFIQQGRIDPRTKIDLHILHSSRLCSCKYGIKIVSTGEELLNIPLELEVSHATEEAVEAIERAGGSVKFVHFNRVTLRAHLFPHKFAILPRRLSLPRKPRKAQIYVEQLPDVWSEKE